MEIKSYDLPTRSDGAYAIETKYCELLTRQRAGENLAEEQKDWMDSANSWLSIL